MEIIQSVGSLRQTQAFELHFSYFGMSFMLFSFYRSISLQITYSSFIFMMNFMMTYSCLYV